jgi:hypothetical protein
MREKNLSEVVGAEFRIPDGENPNLNTEWLFPACTRSSPCFVACAYPRQPTTYRHAINCWISGSSGVAHLRLGLSTSEHAVPVGLSPRLVERLRSPALLDLLRP